MEEEQLNMCVQALVPGPAGWEPVSPASVPDLGGCSPTVTAALLCRDLNHNELQEFPVAIRTLGRLQEL